MRGKEKFKIKKEKKGEEKNFRLFFFLIKIKIRPPPDNWGYRLFFTDAGSKILA